MTDTNTSPVAPTGDAPPPAEPPVEPLAAVLDAASVLLGVHDARLVVGRYGYALDLYTGTGDPVSGVTVPPVPRSIEVWDRPWSDADRTIRGRKWVSLPPAPALAHALRKVAAQSLAERERAVAEARKALALAEQSLADAQARRARLADVVTAALAAVGEKGEALT